LEQTRHDLPSADEHTPLLESILQRVDDRCRITVPEAEEAQSRAALVQAALTMDLNSPVYLSGSIQHGDALTPLDDIDLGVIVAGPLAHSERIRSPEFILSRVSQSLQLRLRKHYPNLTTGIAGQKRSILIRFGNRASGSADFTADVIVALRPSSGPGIFVPNLNSGTWDRSDPLRHNEMMADANAATGDLLNQVARIVKLWNRAHDLPLSSWNIKAICLTCITRHSSLTDGVRRFFDFASDSLTRGPTPDPAGISSPIDFELPQHLVIRHVRNAAREFESIASDSGRPENISPALKKFLGEAISPIDSRSPDY
jgi:hypothetical protein